MLALGIVAERKLVADDSDGHWAFRPMAEVVVPTVEGDTHPIDAFLRKRHTGAGLSESPATDPRVLVRRLFLDLTGLPPSVEEVERFVEKPSDEALAVLIDRLLAKPAYGERWVRHWLDVARYADAKGYVDGGEPRHPFA